MAAEYQSIAARPPRWALVCWALLTSMLIAGALWVRHYSNGREAALSHVALKTRSDSAAGEVFACLNGSRTGLAGAKACGSPSQQSASYKLCLAARHMEIEIEQADAGSLIEIRMRQHEMLRTSDRSILDRCRKRAR
ncbi:hypothetical protein AB2M62_06570 [Sphingomonas sp. MMS12-HWE2-04]|uniref:hypothetical protein n=1 Tax=Sphingomonas sp. MMS12-HWE2-04 TaxID=3234199 RepID=UPI00384AB981